MNSQSGGIKHNIKWKGQLWLPAPRPGFESRLHHRSIEELEDFPSGCSAWVPWDPAVATSNVMSIPPVIDQ